MPFPQRISLDGDDWQLYYLLPNEWRWRRVWEREPPEGAVRQLRAVVPGHVQQDLLDAGWLPSAYEGLNSRLWEWTSQRDWVYSREFTPPAELAGGTLRLRFEGLDHTGHVFLNGEPLGEHSGTLVPFEFDVTDPLRLGKPNKLVVVVERAPDLPGQIGWTSRVHAWKPRFAYGWEGCPRLVPLGLWGSVFLEATGHSWMAGAAIHTNLSTDLKEAAISLVLGFGCRRPGQTVTVRTEITRLGLPVGAAEDPITLFGDETSLVQSITVRRPDLWWPNGSGGGGTGGEPALYEARVTMAAREGEVLDQRRLSFGIRRVELLPNEGATEEALGYTFAVNGERVFARGWNWLPPGQLYGRLMPDRYERLLTLARDAHVNLLRVWSAGLLEREWFYDLCDRFGIMVWQEFPQTGSGLDNRPAVDARYLELIHHQAPSLLAQRQHHPSLVLWCGGSELTHDDGTPLTSEQPALAALKLAVDLDDPQRLWLPTSPSGPTFTPDPEAPGRTHDGHGPWRYLGTPEHYHYYNGIAPLLHSEFGAEGPANEETLEKIGVADEPSSRLWIHPGSAVIRGGDDRLSGEQVTALFGALPDRKQFVCAGQFLQAEGLRYAVEANRRRQWRCSGTLPWQFNEPWPNAIGTSAVDYSGETKPAYDVVRRAYRPFHVSAAYDTIAWHGRSEFAAELWLHNEGAARELLNVVATVADVGGTVFVQENLAAEAPAGTAESVGDVRWRIPAGYAGAFVLFLQVVDEEGQVLAENAYLHSAAPAPPLAPLLAAPHVRLRVESGEWPVEGLPWPFPTDRSTPAASLRLRNTGEAFALGVRLRAPSARPFRFSDNYLFLPPGEERMIAVVGAADEVRVTGWNLEAETGSGE